MLTDKELICSERQVITGAAVSTDSIVATGLLGLDRTSNLRLFVDVDLAFTGGSATALTVEVIQADNATLTTGVELLGSTGPVPRAGLYTGSRLIDGPAPYINKPYLGFRFTPVAGTFGIGAITAGLAPSSETLPQLRPVAHSSHGN